MTAHMGALHGRVHSAVLGGMGLIANIIGTHDLGCAAAYLRSIDHMRFIGRHRIEHARFVGVCGLRGIARCHITDLVGGSRQHLLVNLRGNR